MTGVKKMYVRPGRFPALLCLQVLVGVVMFTGCNRSPEAQKQRYYNKGIQYLKEGKVNEAKLQFLNALKVDVNYAEAASVLAEINFRQRNYQQAYSFLQQALQAQPDYLPARKGMAQMYRAMGKLPDSEKELEYILERSPDDLETLFNLGLVQQLQNKLTDAQGTFNRVLELQPSHVGALLALASVSMASKDLPAAESFLKLALQKNSRSVPVYLSLFKFYITNGQPAKAEELFPQALKDTNNSIDILQAQLGYYEGAKRFDEAEVLVKKIQSVHAKDPAYWASLGEYYVRIHDWPKAKAELEHQLQLHKDDPNILHKLVEVHLNVDGRQAAEALNQTILKKYPKDTYGHLLNGRLALVDGNTEKALEEFNIAAKYQPDWAALHFWIAQAHLLRGELEQAQGELQKALLYDNDYETARLNLAQLQNRSGAVDQALMNARRVLQLSPNNVPAMLICTDSLIRKKDFDQADAALKFIEKHAPESSEFHRLRGVLDLARKNVADGRKEFRRAWELQRQSKGLLDDVLLGFVVQRQTASAIDLLQSEIKDRPSDPLLYYELAQMYLWQAKDGEAVAALQKALALAPDNIDSTVLLADVYASQRKVDQAVPLLAKAMQNRSADSDMLFRCGTVFEKMRLWDQARDAYEHAIRLDSSNALAKNNLAWVLAEHDGNIDVALNLAQQAKEKLTDNLEVTNTVGWVYFKKHVYNTALKYLEECASKDQRNAMFQYEVGMTYWKLGQSADAKRSLTAALKLNPQLPEAQAAVAALSEIADDPTLHRQ